MPGEGKGEGKKVGRPRDPEVADAIIEATLALIAERGFEGLRIADVADRARVSKSTMYRRWMTKHDLVLAALATTPPLEPVDTGTLRGDLRTLLRQFMQVVEEGPLLELLNALVAERLRRAEFARTLDPFVEERISPVRRAIEAAVTRGELAPGVDAARGAELLGGALMLRLFFGGATDPESIEVLIDDVVSMLESAPRAWMRER